MLNWIAYAGAVVLGGAAVFLLCDGLSGISDLGLTEESAIALTMGGMLAVAAVWLTAFGRRRKDRANGDPSGTPPDGNGRP
jgi:hypothetical protein